MSCRKLFQSIVLPAMLLFSQLIFAQDRVVSGKVTDSTGNGLAGVTVTARGTRESTQTNTEGAFRLTVPSSVDALIFSSIGFSTLQVPIPASNSMNVSLIGSASSLNEVVVIGYGTARKKDLTGSVTAITAKDFNKGSVTTPEQLIAGKVAGVEITSNGGAPGSGSTILIRGGASLNASNQPLIVIDGVPIAPDRNPDGSPSIAGSPDPLSLINPNDIESFNILKDASATAIYGSRASNGVIIITTKKGKSGKPRFTFTTQNSISTLPKEADVLSPGEFRAYVNSHGTPAQIAIMGNANTDWQKEIYHNAFSTDNNLSVSGSYKKLPYRISAGYLNQDGILKTGKLERKSASVSLSPKLFDDHLKIDLNLKGSISNSRFANEGAIGEAVRFDPTQPVFSGSKRFGGYFEWLDPNSTTGLKALAPRNPLGELEQRQDKSEVKRSIGNIQFDYKLHFLPDLHVNLNLGYDISDGRGTIVVPDSAASSYDRFQNPAGSGHFFGGVNNQYHQKNSNTIIESYLNYVKDIKVIKSHVDATAGYSYQDYSTTNYNFPDLTSNGTVVSSPSFPFDKPENRIISFFGRLNYSFQNKYLLTGTIRRDGSSRFSKENRWGWFPSGAFAWRMKDEDFLKNSNTVSDLKLRLGYGITGQQDGIGNYTYLPIYSLANQQAEYQFGNTFDSLYRPNGYNPNLKWEQTATYNAGLDFGFINNRISGSIDVYLKKTTDLLSVIDQPAGTNFSNKVLANIGNMENRGIEFTINTQPVRNKTITWDFGFNITYNVNKITKLTIVNDPTFPGNLVGGIAGGVGSTIQIHTVGYPKSSFYVYQQIYSKDGKPIEGLFEDRNRDGLINNNDLYKYKAPDPKAFLGAYTNVSWRKWSAAVSVRADIGNYMYNNRFANTGVQRNIIDPLGFLANGSRNVLETNFTGNGDQYLLSDYYIENASFLRMDYINIGYNAGDLVSRNTNLRIGANVQNVFTVTKYKGVDPEVPGGIDNNFYPRPRIYSISLNLDF